MSRDSLSVSVPFDLAHRSEVLALFALLKEGGHPFPGPRSLSTIVTTWLYWGRCGYVWREVEVECPGDSLWVKSLWASIEPGNQSVPSRSFFELMVKAGVFVFSEDKRAVTLAGYADYNLHLDPLHLSGSQKGQNLRWFAQSQKQAKRAAVDRMELAASAGAELPFERSGTVDERREALELIYGIQAAMQWTVEDPDSGCLDVALGVVQGFTQEAVEAGVRGIAAHRDRPDLKAMALDEILSRFEVLLSAFAPDFKGAVRKTRTN